MGKTIDNVQSPFYVIEISPEVKEKTVHWIVNKLTSPRSEGGCELLVFYTQPGDNGGLYLLVSISHERAIYVATQLRLRKKDLSGKIREFNSTDLDYFAAKNEYDSLFTEAELLSIIKHEIDNFRAEKYLESEDFVPDNVRFFQGQSIIEKLLHKELVQNVFPLQNRETLKRLKFEWCGNIAQPQPLESIREYFGEGIALYFAFLSEYTKALLVLATLGLLQLLFFAPSFSSNLIFCILYLLWSFAFFQSWKRRSNELAYDWGTFANQVTYDEPRANFKGDLQPNPVTGDLEPFYPRWQTLCKVYLGSVPIVICCLVAGFWAMHLSFEADSAIRDQGYSELVTLGLVQIPGLIYAVVVWVASRYYRVLATKLTEWENHRTESQFDRNRATKILLFEFINYIVFLLYIAFYKRNFALLRSQLTLMLIVFQLLNHVTETVLPYMTRRKPDRSSSTDKNGWKNRYGFLESVTNSQPVDCDHPIAVQAYKESQLLPYIGTHEDYLELFIQFGYVLLFIVTYPLAALWAFLSNVIELRADAFKLCGVFRRPPVLRAKHIGAWLPAFQFLCALAVITNCGLVFLIDLEDKDIDSGDQQDSWNRAWVCLVTEHALLAIQVLLHLVVPAIPDWVKRELVSTQ